MKTNERTLVLIRKWEGLRLNSYEDLGGVITIGYGHTGPDIKHPMTITLNRAEVLLISDVTKVENKLKTMLPETLTPNQFGAIVSLVFNVGINNFKGRKLHEYLLTGRLDKAADRILLYNKVQGREIWGLSKRRKEERELFLSKE